MKKKILFVCLGNICRSPAAEEIFRAMIAARGLDGKYETDSAGTYGGHAGEKADVRMRSAASRRGYNITHRSRRVAEGDFEEFDMLIAMDDSNYENLHRLAPTIEGGQKIYRMVEFGSRNDYSHIPDPYYEGAEGFEIVLDLLEDACGGLLDKLEAGEL